MYLFPRHWLEENCTRLADAPMENTMINTKILVLRATSDMDFGRCLVFPDLVLP